MESVFRHVCMSVYVCRQPCPLSGFSHRTLHPTKKLPFSGRNTPRSSFESLENHVNTPSSSTTSGRKCCVCGFGLSTTWSRHLLLRWYHLLSRSIVNGYYRHKKQFKHADAYTTIEGPDRPSCRVKSIWMLSLIFLPTELVPCFCLHPMPFFSLHCL